ncbi:MAG: hypothetical protein HC922_08920 [Leptolyngbyaceae cyanobacterium SM2_3_12]|nr:hypothetical protein [Leptolyngbyaceae cyanobacterium SM2_3_12]
MSFYSPGTEAEDLGRFHGAEAEASPESARPTAEASEPSVARPPGKLEAYEQYLRVPHYLVYSRYTRRLRYFKLDGGHYQEQALNAENPMAWLADLDIGLGLWQGDFEGIPGYWLRWCDAAGQWFLTDAEQSKQQAEQSQAQLLKAARNLLATGMPVEQVAQLLALSGQQISQL